MVDTFVVLASHGSGPPAYGVLFGAIVIVAAGLAIALKWRR